MKVTKENVGEILQHLYDSEIDFHMGWLWDGGVDFSLENTPYPLTTYKQDLVQHTGSNDIADVMRVVVEDVVEKFPHSTFAKWFTDRNSVSAQEIK